MKNNNFSLSNLTDEDYMNIANRLVYLRSNILQLDQKPCANALDISQPYLSLLEKGERKVTDEIIDKYVERLHTNRDWLVNGVGSNPVIKDNASNNAKFYIQKKQNDAFQAVKEAYQLNKADSEFILHLLSMDTTKRKRFIKAITEIKDL